MRWLLLVPVALLVLLAGVPLLLHRHRAARALALRRAALGWAAFVVLFTTSFVATSAVEDPGGAAGAGLALAVVVPVVALVALAWWRPRPAAALLAVLTALVVLGALAQAVTTPHRAGLDAHGPVLAVGAFVVVAGASALGWHRPGLAAVLLLVLGAAPVLAVALADRRGDLLGGSTAFLTVPGFVTGLLYLLAWAVGRGTREGTGYGPADTRSHPAPATGPAPEDQAGASGVPR